MSWLEKPAAMSAMRAVNASRPVHEPARHGAARTDPLAGRAGFHAVLEAAAEGVGKPVVAIPDEPPPPRLGQPMLRLLPAGQEAPADAFEIVAAAADGSGLPTPVPIGAGAGVAKAREGDPRPGAAAERSAAGPAVPPAKPGADAKHALPLLPPHLAPIGPSSAPAPGEAGTGKPAPAPAKGPPHPAEGTPGTPSHASAHRQSAADATAQRLPAAAAMSLQGVIAAGLPAAPPAARADAADASARTRTGRSSPPLRAPLDGPASRQPQETAPRADPPGVSEEDAGSRSSPAHPADSGGPAAGSPLAAPSAPSPQTAAARVEGKPLPPSDGIAPAPDHSPPRDQPPAGLVAGPVAYAADPPPASDAGAAAKPENAAPAPDVPPPRLADQLSSPIISAAADGRRDLALRLHPPELGEVSVRLVVSGRAVSAWFDSPQPQVQQAISQGMGELRADLATAGWDLSGAWIGGQAWTPRERTASPAAPRPTRPMTGGEPVQEARGVAPAAAGAGVSVYV